MIAPAAVDRAHIYDLFGCTVRSAIPLPGVAAADVSTAPSVSIRYGPVAPPPEAGPGYHVTGSSAVLTVPDVARFGIAEGREIVIDPAPGADERDIRVFLLGSAMGALLHQRGQWPLHANAVVVEGRAFAFMGQSGAGKSTLAAWLLDRGYSILTDDVCVISADAGRVIAHRGLSRLRLCRDALERSGREASEATRSFRDQDKFDVPVAASRMPPPSVPLGAIFLLSRAPSGRFAAHRLHGVGAVEALMAHTYRGEYLRLSGREGDHLRRCVRLARAVPIVAVGRAWGFADFDDQAARLVQLALSFAGTGYGGSA